MIKVLLVHTVFRKGTSTSEPLGLEYLATYLLTRGIDVRICDESHQNLDKIYNEYRPTYLGISAMTSTIERAYEIAQKYHGQCWTVIGGVHATIYPEEVAKFADFVVVGDGEDALYNIVMGRKPFGIVRGEPTALDILPARHLVDIEYYSNEMATRWFFGQGHKTTVIMTSRGCPFRCTYCWNSTRKEKVRYQTSEMVITEIKHLLKEYGIRSFYFVDDDFLLPHSRFKDIATKIMMEGLDIRYSINSRSTSVNPEVLSIFKESGGQFISFGFESGSQRILDVLNKRSTVEDNVKAIRLCKKYGISILGWIMVGNPTETPEDIELSKKFILNNPIDFITICMTTVFPGTKMWDYCQENKLIPEGHKWSDYNVAEVGKGWSPNTAMSRDEIVKAYNDLVELAENNKQKMSLSTAVRIFRNNPLGSFKYINRLGKLIKRLK